MDAERLKLVDQLTRTLQVAESMDWQPERTWRSILKPLCGEDEDLVQEVIDNARFAMSGPSDEDFSKLIIQPLDGSYPELPRYRVVGILGHGGMGVVYKVHFQADAFSEFRALKMMKRVPNLDLGLYLSRFEKERKILAKLNHPNIINILDDGTIDGLPYLVMPLVPGAKRLDEYCSSNHLSLAERLALFRTVCSAVESAHGKNVTHRDIKPSNLLVSDSGFVMVVDWGLAIELLSGPLIPSVLGGTEGYASPEQKRGDKEITPSADIYSLGQVLSALVLDSPEYADASVNLIDAKVRAALDAVIFVATRPLPQDRFLTVAALAAKIDALISDLNRENASDTHRPRFFNALNRRKTASVAAGLIITGAAMLWWILPRWSGAINETQQTRITPSPAATTTRTTPHPLKMIPEMKVQERAGEQIAQEPTIKKTDFGQTDSATQEKGAVVPSNLEPPKEIPHSGTVIDSLVGLDSPVQVNLKSGLVVPHLFLNTNGSRLLVTGLISQLNAFGDSSVKKYIALKDVASGKTLVESDALPGNTYSPIPDAASDNLNFALIACTFVHIDESKGKVSVLPDPSFCKEGGQNPVSISNSGGILLAVRGEITDSFQKQTVTLPQHRTCRWDRNVIIFPVTKEHSCDYNMNYITMSDLYDNKEVEYLLIGDMSRHKFPLRIWRGDESFDNYYALSVVDKGATVVGIRGKMVFLADAKQVS